MKKRKGWRHIAMLLTVCLVITSIPAMAFATEADGGAPPQDGQNGPDASLENVTEDDVIDEESSEYVTAFDLGNDTRAKVFTSYPVRYEDENGEMKEVDPELVPVDETGEAGDGTSLEGYAYENKAGKFKQYIPKNMSEGTPVIMENGKYAVSMSPMGWLNGIMNKNKHAERKEDETVDVTGKTKKKKVTAAYGSTDGEASIEYTSLHDGLKESIVLSEVPKKNEFSYRLKLKGLTAKANPIDAGITFFDKSTGEIVGAIEAPYMNDATGEAYSEAIRCDLKRQGKSDNYTLTLTVDEAYLNDADRQYPVTIDPTATWIGTAEVRDAYIISTYPTSNFYSSDTKIMPSGRGSGSAKYRTCINFIGIRSELLDCNISSANFDIYETGNSSKGNVVRVYRILESWTAANVTWNTCPDYGTATSYIDYNNSTGVTNRKMTFDVTSWVSRIAGGGSNFGLMLKNQIEASTSYTEFYGTRTGATSYRPKLTVVYTQDKPTTATSVTASKSGYNVGESISVTWEGITANNLDHIEYRVARYDADGNVINDQYVPYTRLTSAKSSGTATIPNSGSFPTGRYGIYIRGVSGSGVNGTGKRSQVVTVSKDKPSTPTSVYPSKDTYPEGSLVTMNWEGLTAKSLAKVQYRVAFYDENWEEIEYAYVPYTDLSVTPASSGSVVLPDSDEYESGNYKIFIRGVSSAGVTGTGKGGKVVIDENGDPTIDTLNVTIGGTSAGDSAYVKPGAASVLADYIRDEKPVTAGNLSYSLYGPSGNKVGVSLSSSTVRTNSDGSYWTVFSIPESDISQSGTYTLYFWVFDDAGNLGSISKTFLIDGTAPTGEILVNDGIYGNETDTVTEKAKISAKVGDGHSGVASSTLALYKGTRENPGDKVKDLISASSISKVTDFDAADYDNGSYCLKLTVTDKVGNSKTVWKDLTVAKPMKKPDVSVRMQGGNRQLTVSWGFQDEMAELDHIQYSLDGGAWTDVEITGKVKGTFDVPLDEGMEGTHHIAVRGVDADGIGGESTRVDFNIDTEAPQVTIGGIVNGIILGTVTDDNLDSWKVYVKARDVDDAEYTETASGTRPVANGRIAPAGLADSRFEEGAWYTVKLEAVDKSGNKGSDTFDVYKDEGDTYGSVIPSEHRILRSLGQDYSLPHFIVSTTEDRLEMKDGSLFDSGAWFVDGSLVSEEKDFRADFSAYEEGRDYKVEAAGRDAAGGLYYSNDIFTNAVSLSVAMPAAEGNQSEMTVPLLEQAVGFTLDTEQAEGVTWYAKIGDGEYKQITPGELTYVLNLDGRQIAASAFQFKAVSEDPALLEDAAFTLQLAVMETETFEVSSAEGCWPENTTAQDKINYKTYVRWDIPEERPEGLSYEVYRSTIENFVPSERTLVAEDVTDGYWCDINTNYSISLYYKVRAVIKDKDGRVLSASSYSDTAESTPIDRDEYKKALGHKEYWAYADIATPSGSGYIEKSQGNFVYEQTDAEIPNEQLAVALTRTYNSMATSKSGFGYGWTHSYDIELLKLGKDNSLEDGILVLRDGSGTLYQFKNEGDTYISSLGKHVNLKKEDKTQAIALNNPGADGGNQVTTVNVASAYTMTTRDGQTYYFDASGKLVWMEEANGNLLLFHYDEKRGLLDRITTGNNISVEFTYNESAGGNDALTIHDMTLPDGQKIVYNYQNSLLTGVTKYPAGQAGGGITYSYGYSGRKMTSLTDGVGNTYGIQYSGTGGKTDRFNYPAAGGTSESIRVSQNTEGYALTEKLAGGTVVKQEKDYFDGSGQCIRHTDILGGKAQSVSYEYKDSLLTKKTETVSYGTLNKDGDNAGSVVTGEKEKVTTYTYDDNELVVREHDEDTAISEFLYAHDGEWSEYQPSSYTETTADGVRTADEVYQYDDFGNMVRMTDLVAGTFTVYSYYTGASDTAKGALKSEAEYLMEDGTCISSNDIDIEMLAGGRKKETTTVISGGNKTVTETTYDVMGRELSSVTWTYTAFGTSRQKIGREEKAYTYDGFGRMTGITTTTSKADASLNEIEGTAHTVSESRTYDGNGTLLSETGTDGITSDYQYDAMNRVTRTAKSGGGLTQVSQTSYGYGDVSVNEGRDARTSYHNALMTTETVDGLVMNVTYQDGLGRTVREEADGVVTDYSYDLQGNQLTSYTQTSGDTGLLVLHVLDEDGNETATLRNPVWDAGSGSYILGADTICETAGYDKAGNLTSQTDGEGNTTLFTYDEQGRITGVNLTGKGNASNKTSYSYREAGEDGLYRSSVTRTGPDGAASTETADGDGNILQTRDEGSGAAAIETTASYDAYGNVLETAQSSGRKTRYTYDAKDRVSEKTQYAADGSARYKTVYTYYADDQVKEMYDYKVSGSSQTLYHYVYNTYDGLKRLKTTAEVNGSSVPSDLSAHTITYTYDLKDRITAVSYGSGSGSEVDGLFYEYSGSRLADIRVKIGGSTYLAKAYTYNADGSVESVKDYYNFKSGDTTSHVLLTYGYDVFGRVSAMDYTKDGAAFEKHAYSYDKNNNITRERSVNALAGTDEVREYSYDYRNQLASSTVKDVITETVTVEGEADEDGNPTYTTQTVTREETKLQTAYAYDAAGNRTKKTENGKATTYTYNGLNQLLSESGTGTNLSYTYDADGNQTKVSGTADGSSVSRSYTYTPENMLETYTEGSKTQANLYNGEGQRVQKKEGGSTTDYFYQMGSVLYTGDGDGNLKSFNLLDEEDAFGTERKDGSGHDYYLYTKDAKGSTVNVLDKAGSRVVSYRYDDFGDVAESKASGYSGFENELQYTGAVRDGMTGLLYLNARYYEPRTGRFITRDTYRGERENADTWHLYAYCANNPINRVDPSGNWFFVPFLLKGAAVVIGGVVLAAYTQTNEFQDAWNRAARGIENALGEASKYVKSKAKSLSKAIGKSFSKAKRRYKGKTEVHHIVAKAHPRAKVARWVFKKVKKKTSEEDNLIRIKKGLHKRLHRKDYFSMVNSVMQSAYYKKSKRSKRANVEIALDQLRAYVSTLDRIAPF